MKPLLLACTLAVAISAIAADKPNSTKVTGTVLTPKSMKDYAHKAGKETKTKITIGEAGKITAGMSYYLTCFVIDAKGKRYLMGEKDGKRGLCKVLTGGNPNKVNLILRDLRK